MKRSYFQTKTVNIPGFGPLTIPHLGNTIVIKNASGNISMTVPGDAVGVDLPIGRVFRFDAPFGNGQIALSSDKINDVVTYDEGEGLVIPLDHIIQVLNPGPQALFDGQVITHSPPGTVNANLNNDFQSVTFVISGMPGDKVSIGVKVNSSPYQDTYNFDGFNGIVSVPPNIATINSTARFFGTVNVAGCSNIAFTAPSGNAADITLWATATARKRP